MNEQTAKTIESRSATTGNARPDPAVLEEILEALVSTPVSRLFQVTVAESALRVASGAVRYHAHDEMQLELILRAGSYILGSRRFHFNDYVFLVIPPGIPHSFSADDGSTQRHLTAKLLPLHPVLLKIPPLALVSPARAYLQNTADQMRHMVEEWQLRQWGYQYTVPLRMLTVLVDTLRNWQLPGSAGQNDTLEEARRYIALNHARQISPQDVALHCGLRPDSLCRIFRKSLGTSPGQYLLDTRLQHACALLRAGHSVTSAAERSGFSSIHYFSRVFRARNQLSPTAWAKSQNPVRDPLAPDFPSPFQVM